MEQNRPSTAPGAEADRARFERVWQRVMPTPRPDCPFTLYGEGEGPDHRMMPPAGDAPDDMPPALELGLAPMISVAAPAEEEGVPLLGGASAVHGELLQSMIADELCDARTYQNMARRVTGNAVRVLLNIAGDERRHAKRLSVAYFLISGVRYWPDQLPGVPMRTFLGGARWRFIAEQQGEAAYRRAAAETKDSSLRELFLELAADEAAHAWLLRGILEQL